ncbi:hypothetical protein ABT336_00245 [Micromonospora sp. NPDC000207]|uniref:hypothetical protein n=1 Tax=Micromonospora sp. NPDC000207 TaxID=3154246 RepID=UPI003320E6B0
MSDRVVTTDIPLGDPGRGVFAFRVGDRVPEQQVKENGWEAYVASPKSAAGQQAAAEAAGTAPAKSGGRG